MVGAAAYLATVRGGQEMSDGTQKSTKNFN
jgi:hypothetical protein